MNRLTQPTFAALALFAAGAHAQQPSPAMPGMDMPHPPGVAPAATAQAAAAQAAAAMMEAMQKMAKDMAAAPMTGNADRDFVAMMLPHHQGAVDMARVELAYGHDSAMRKLAQAVVAAQEREIAQMKAWQATNHAK